MAPQRSRHVSALDGVRGIAVAIVVVHHLQVPGLGGLYTGVDVFFALSGYLITATLLKLDRGRDIGSFWVRRAWRVGPAAAVLLAWYAVATIGAPDRELRIDHLRAAAFQYLNIDMAGGPPPMTTSPHLGHLWSLAAEVQFYVLWPIVAVLLMRRRFGPTLLLLVATGITVATAVARFVLEQHDAAWGRLYFGADVRATALFAGCMVALLLHVRPAAKDALHRWSGVLVLPAVAVLVWYGLEASLTWRPGMAWGLSLVSLAAGIIVLHATGPGHTFINRLLAVRPAVWLGRVSYSLYLWHVPVIAVIVARWPGIGTAQKAAVAVPVSLALTVASYRLVEQPFLSGSRRHRRTLARKAALAGTKPTA